MKSSKLTVTPRQKQILTFLAQGLTYKQISVRICISVRMIKRHVKEARLKLGAETREQAVALAIQNHLIGLEG